jgi:hypothetical protein
MEIPQRRSREQAVRGWQPSAVWSENKPLTGVPTFVPQARDFGGLLTAPIPARLCYRIVIVILIVLVCLARENENEYEVEDFS